jgi:LPS export ABC transporter protein LptC
MPELLKHNKNNGIIVFLAFTVLPFLVGCKQTFDEYSHIPNITDYPMMSATDIDLYQSQNGKKTLRIIAQTVNMFSFREAPTTEFPDGIMIEFFDESGTVSSYLSANSAIYYEKENRWEAFGNIEAQNVEGAIFNTEYIEWNEKEELIKSDKAVKITDKDGIFFGRGFRSKQDFTDWTILHPTGDFLFDQNEILSDK